MKLLFSVTKKDLKIQTFRSGGPGGQNQNKRDTGIRIVHSASGAVGESRTERSQHANRKLALRRLADSIKFKIWQNRMINEVLSGKTIDERVDEMMEPKNLKLEHREAGQWVPMVN